MRSRQDGSRRSTRKPDRAATEQALMESALALLERDGILAGLNMQEAADEAGVNRGLIHHYFGSRRALLRAALDRALQHAAAENEHVRRLSPYAKGSRQFRDYVAEPGFARLLALLALDGDDQFEPIPLAKERLEDYERERREGIFVDDIDVEASLTVWDATLLGYSLIREGVSRQLDIPLRTLDRRVLVMLGRQWEALRGEGDDRGGRGSRGKQPAVSPSAR